MKTKYIYLSFLMLIGVCTLKAQDKQIGVNVQVKNEKLEIVIEGDCGNGLVHEVGISQNGRDFFQSGSLHDGMEVMDSDLQSSIQGINYIRVRTYDLQKQSSTSNVKVILLDTPVEQVIIKSKDIEPKNHI